MNQIAIAQLNQMSQAEFTEALGKIWEDSPEPNELGITNSLKI